MFESRIPPPPPVFNVPISGPVEVLPNRLLWKTARWLKNFHDMNRFIRQRMQQYNTNTNAQTYLDYTNHAYKIDRWNKYTKQQHIYTFWHGPRVWGQTVGQTDGRTDIWGSHSTVFHAKRVNLNQNGPQSLMGATFLKHLVVALFSMPFCPVAFCPVACTLLR